MANSIALALSRNLQETIKELAADPPTRDHQGTGLIIHIHKEEFALKEIVQPEQNPKDSLKTDKAAFVLLKVDSHKKQAFALAAFVPDLAIVREKMLYSAARDTLRRALTSALNIQREAHWASLDDVNIHSLVRAEDSIVSSDLNALSNDALTDIEKLKIEDDYATSIEAAGAAVSSASVSFPASDVALTGLRDFIDGSRLAILFHITNESLDIISTHGNVDILEADISCASRIHAVLPSSEPAYALFRYSQDAVPKKARAFFIYSCPEGCGARLKMIHAAAKKEVMSWICSQGVEFLQSFEVTEAGDLTDEMLGLGLFGGGSSNPSSCGIVGGSSTNFSKPAPRGGRQLTRRKPLS